MAIPGRVYGGLIASLIGCHCTGTAAAIAYRAEGREMDTDPYFRFVTASLRVDYLRPTPLGVPLEIRAHAKEVECPGLLRYDSIRPIDKTFGKK
jgi:acyl-coenzyme A thioesterase PaaI-like protein